MIKTMSTGSLLEARARLDCCQQLDTIERCSCGVYCLWLKHVLATTMSEREDACGPVNVWVALGKPRRLENDVKDRSEPRSVTRKERGSE